MNPPEPRVVLDPAVIARYPRFSRYNSPYPAHDQGRAIDLYPTDNTARSPVAGTVLETHTVGCPTREYAVDTDHLICIAVDAGGWLATSDTDTTLVARILHVEPRVEPGDAIEIGDPLGSMVRSGFFGQWVDNHIHLDFRLSSQHRRRASGSLPLVADVPVAGLRWDGIGTVTETGPTHLVVDSPISTGPDGGSMSDRTGFVALAAECGTPLDGGFAHYSGGGVLDERGDSGGRTLRFLGQPVGTVETTRVVWNDIDLLANGERITGLSLFASRTGYGTKLVAPGHEWCTGDRIELSVRQSTEPIRLSGHD